MGILISRLLYLLSMKQLEMLTRKKVSSFIAFLARNLKCG